MRKLFKERKLFKGGNYMRKYGTWNMRRLVDESFVPATQRPSVLYWRLSDFKLCKRDSVCHSSCNIWATNIFAHNRQLSFGHQIQHCAYLCYLVQHAHLQFQLEVGFKPAALTKKSLLVMELWSQFTFTWISDSWLVILPKLDFNQMKTEKFSFMRYLLNAIWRLSPV